MLGKKLRVKQHSISYTKRLLLLISAVIIGLGVFHSHYSPKVGVAVQDALIPASIRLELDSVYSSTAKQEIAFHIQQHLPSVLSGKIPFQDLHKDLKRSFPFITSCELDFHNHNEAVINIKGEEPLYCVNNTNVVSQSGTFYESNQFSEYLAGHKLETVFIPESLLTSSKDSFGLMVKDIPSPCFNDYHIVLKSFYDVLLKPKNSLCHYSVMVDPTTWHDEKKLETASKLGALLAYEIPVLKKRKEMKDYIIDVRFKNRIYARKAQPLSFELGAKGGGKNELKHNT